MEIMKLNPTGKDYLWGGKRLKEEFHKDLNLTPLAETWECSIHPDGMSTVINGTSKGKTLYSILQEHPEYLGTKIKNGKLPILVKFIDAQKDLSIQVHPNDDYAQRVENENGKTEMWYILDAKPGAHLVYGFEHDIDANQLIESIESNTLMKHLHREDVQKGDVIFVPAGTVHGIGAGMLVAEIQENSNVTYRVYDYNRLDKSGKKRELHVEKAIQVLNMKKIDRTGYKRKLIHFYPGCSREILCRCKYFETERIKVKTGFSFSVKKESFQVLLCLSGNGQIEFSSGEKKPVRFRKGECLFLPAAMGRCYVLGDTELLKIRC